MFGDSYYEKVSLTRMNTIDPYQDFKNIPIPCTGKGIAFNPWL